MDERSIEEVLDAIGDEYARDVLAAVCESARSAQDIAAHLEHSIQTVYRRIHMLENHGLVESETQIVSDGNHYQVYAATFDSVVISVENEAYDVEIYRQGDVPDRFTALWDDLSRPG